MESPKVQKVSHWPSKFPKHAQLAKNPIWMLEFLHPNNFFAMQKRPTPTQGTCRYGLMYQSSSIRHPTHGHHVPHNNGFKWLQPKLQGRGSNKKRKWQFKPWRGNCIFWKKNSINLQSFAVKIVEGKKSIVASGFWQLTASKTKSHFKVWAKNS